jgi:hypothetical protein
MKRVEDIHVPVADKSVHGAVDTPETTVGEDCVALPEEHCAAQEDTRPASKTRLSQLSQVECEAQVKRVLKDTLCKQQLPKRLPLSQVTGHPLVSWERFANQRSNEYSSSSDQEWDKDFTIEPCNMELDYSEDEDEFSTRALHETPEAYIATRLVPNKKRDIKFSSDRRAALNAIAKYERQKARAESAGGRRLSGR